MSLTPLWFAMLVAGAQPPALAGQTPTPPATAVIRGHVIAGDTGQPLRNAQVHLIQIEAPGGGTPLSRENRTVNTDAEGRYELKDLPGGRYQLSAAKGAYVQVSWGEQPGAMPKPFELHAGESLDRLDFTLPRGGVITGRVLDEFGEPLTGITISAMRIRTIGGRRQLTGAGGAGTNDEGAFRLFGLQPGQYVVQAVWGRVAQGDPTSPDRTGYPVTFFPGTTNEAEAQRFTVAAGQAIGDLVMAMSPIKTLRIDGTVVGADGQPMGTVFLQVLQSSGNANSMNGQWVRPDGTFTFTNVTPGEYTFRTEATTAHKGAAMLKVTVGSEDIKDLRLVALPLATVSGRILIDPSTPLPSVAFSLMAMLESPQMPGGMQPARISDDLSFELTAMPGRNRLVALNLPPGWTIRAARVGNADVMDEGLEVRPGEPVTGVEVELTNKVTAVSGLVTNARGEPAKEYTLLMFPTDARLWKPSSRYFRAATPDQDGRFKLSGVVPSDYYIIALEKLQVSQWRDPEFLERLRSKASTFKVVEGETKTVDLKIASAP